MPASSVTLCGRVCRVGSACAVSSWSAACDCLAAGAPGRTACCPRPARLLAEAGGRRSAVRQAATPQWLRRDAAADANGQIPVLSGSGPKGRALNTHPGATCPSLGGSRSHFLRGRRRRRRHSALVPAGRPARGRCSAMPRRHCQLHGGCIRTDTPGSLPARDRLLSRAQGPPTERGAPLWGRTSKSPATRASHGASGPAARPIRVAAQPRARRRGAPAPTVKRH